MSFSSKGKNYSTMFALSVLTVALLGQSPWWKADKPVLSEEGVFNYSMGYVPGHVDKVEYIENKATTALGRYFQKKLEKIMIYFFSEYHTIDFLNARKADLDYHVCGFSLIDSPMEQSDWTVKENREKFYSAMEPIIRELHSDIAEFTWIDEAFLARSVDGGNEPAIDVAHLDYHVNQTLTKPWAGYDLHDFGVDMILGLWMPDNMDSPVVDYPLAVVDGSTFEPEDTIPFFGEVEQTLMDGSTDVRRFVSSVLKYSPKHKYYYYPNQTSNELLLFRQYTNENTLGAFVNPHTSFTVPDFPRDAPSRRSVEMRVGITFKQDVAKTSS